MKLHYETPEGKSTWWYVEELKKGVAYLMVDDKGQPDPITVSNRSGGSAEIAGFDGFLIEDNNIFVVSLLVPTHRIHVGSRPEITP